MDLLADVSEQLSTKRAYGVTCASAAAAAGALPVGNLRDAALCAGSAATLLVGASADQAAALELVRDAHAQLVAEARG